MNLIDTHCHIHESEFFADASEQEAVYKRAIEAGVSIICVATSEAGSREALAFTASHDQTWAVLGVHPHAAKDGCAEVGALLGQKNSKVIGVGEIGLDYHYDNSPHADQIAVLEQQLQWAVDYDLPVSFHVRDAFEDFWPIFDNFHGIRGVMHSFTDTQKNLDQGFARGLYVGVNGISTFTKDAEQQKLYTGITLERMVLETDAPFLTPAPLRGKMNEPSYVGRVAEHVALLRGVYASDVATITADNARNLFAI
jgi:TatD DNase family protein